MIRASQLGLDVGQFDIGLNTGAKRAIVVPGQLVGSF